MALGLLLSSMACGGSAYQHGVLLTIVAGEGVPAPDRLLLTWRDEDANVLLERNLPVSAAAAGQAPGALAVVMIETAAGTTGDRLAVVQGLRNGLTINEGAVAVTLDPLGVRPGTLTLLAGRLPDADGDGVPDAIDVCPATIGTRCEGRGRDDGGVGADTGVPQSGGNDGGADSAPADAGPMDTSPMAPPPDAATGPDGPPPRIALLVVANPASLVMGDALMRARLEALGMTVVPKRWQETTAADAEGTRLVVISSTTDGATFAGRLRDVAVPVLCMEGSAMVNLGMTATVGSVSNQTKLGVLAGHPIAAGLSGDIDVASRGVSVIWGTPQPAAVVVAHVLGVPMRPAIWGYDQGAMMEGLVAPARRVAWFASSENTAPHLTPAGWALFDAAVKWAARL